jgi:hypothetical protein
MRLIKSLCLLLASRLVVGLDSSDIGLTFDSENDHHLPVLKLPQSIHLRDRLATRLQHLWREC